MWTSGVESTEGQLLILLIFRSNFWNSETIGGRYESDVSSVSGTSHPSISTSSD